MAVTLFGFSTLASWGGCRSCQCIQGCVMNVWISNFISFKSTMLREHGSFMVKGYKKWRGFLQSYCRVTFLMSMWSHSMFCNNTALLRICLTWSVTVQVIQEMLFNIIIQFYHKRGLDHHVRTGNQLSRRFLWDGRCTSNESQTPYVPGSKPCMAEALWLT